MEIFDSYSMALWGIWVTIATLMAQALIAGSTKARRPGAIPGKIDDALSHDSFVFRAHRTFMNSLENLPALFGTAFLAILAGADPGWTGTLIWVFAGARLLHMALYYGIATEKNPSPRTWFYLIALIANVALLVLAAMALL